MAASFASASSQSLSTTSPLLPSTGYPFAVGMWVYPTTSGVEKTLFSFADTASADNYLEVRQNASNQFVAAAAAGGAEVTATAGINGTRWHFVLVRFDSATLRRIDVLSPTGQTPSGNNTTSTAPTSLDTLALGARIASTTTQYFDGFIGEFWYANVNIQPAGGATQTPVLRQLGRGGPFSVPKVAQNLVQYWSFREHPTAPKGEEAFIGAGKAWQGWTNTGGVTTGPHPPLPFWYERPRPARRPLVF